MLPKISKILSVLIAALCALALYQYFSNPSQTSTLPVVAIANYGPHSSVQSTIEGLQEELKSQGFEEGRNIHFETLDVHFDPSLIAQMLSTLKAKKPAVIVTLTTPVSQAAKNSITDIPIVFADVTDPQEAGLLTTKTGHTNNMTGASDKQDLRSVLQFAKRLVPEAHRVGLLYSTSEANDTALVHMMETAAKQESFSVLAIPIEHPRDIPARMAAFKGQVDFLYVGSSGPIQPSLPAIVATAETMNLPVINMNIAEAKEDKVLASFGVSYEKVGKNTGLLVAKILKGIKPSDAPILYPAAEDHEAFVSQKRAAAIGLVIPSNITLP